jgi:DNA-binding transcriptional regulator YiaG
MTTALASLILTRHLRSTPHSEYPIDIVNGAELRKLRHRAGWTQRELAEAMAVVSNTVARWERDELRIQEPYARLALLTVEKHLRSDKGKKGK